MSPPSNPTQSITIQRPSNRQRHVPVILCGSMIMDLSIKELATSVVRCCLITLTLLGVVTVAAAQAARPSPDPSLPRASQGDEPDPLTSIEEEMRGKRAIKFAEKEYRENIERAHELASLGSQLENSYKKNQQFVREDFKKLDRLEKLAKSIRNAAGGSDSEKEADRPSGNPNLNVTKMFSVVESLANRVEKTPRHVISAEVIDEANVLLELIRLVRTYSLKD